MNPPKTDPRTQRVVVKMNTADLTLLDEQRGGTARGPHLRNLMYAARGSAAVPDRPPYDGETTDDEQHRHRYFVDANAHPHHYEKGLAFWLAYCECGAHTLTDRRVVRG